MDVYNMKYLKYLPKEVRTITYIKKKKKKSVFCIKKQTKLKQNVERGLSFSLKR